MEQSFLSLCIIFIIVYKSLIVVHESNVYIIERLGKYYKTATAGLNFLWPFLDKVRAIVDLREQTMITPSLKITTRDNVSLDVSLLINFSITDPVKAVYETANLREFISTSAFKNLEYTINDIYFDDIQKDASTIGEDLKRTLNTQAFDKGYLINSVCIKTSNINN